ncbi:MAG: long-chain acyl-CoA synthetase [Elusimicrobia bacterium]|nr:MAG: long-chain acyl-CoA synthetase [Elusimicrobiota bacterium]KAF0154156.1 MAG: long-chain acyl-CoA synthetase [Elusimicrobiota bacterium]
MDRNIGEFLRNRAALSGRAAAIEARLRYRTVSWTYAELERRAEALAHALAGLGVGRGDRVLLISPNQPHWAAAYFAILFRGAAVVPLNPQSTPAQIDRIIRACGPKALLKSAGVAWGSAPLPAVTIDREAFAGAPAGSAPPPGGAVAERDDTAEIIYTSGTTGEPKGVVLTHGNILSDLEALAGLEPLKPGDRVFSIVPLFHMYGQLAGLLYPMYHGAAATYALSLSSRAIIGVLSGAPITHMVVVPEFLRTVMARVEAGAPRWCRGRLLRLFRGRISKTLRTIACGGAPLDPEIERKWRLMGFEILQGYGLTEASPVVTTNTRRNHRPGTVGRPLPGIELKLSAGGEVLVKGPNVMRGYYLDEKSTRESFDGQWLKTGDMGSLDAGGFLRVFGRRQYMILGPGGENVFPEDLEAELNKVGGVRDSAVLGLEEDGRYVVHAVLLGDCEAEAAVASANRRLAPHQQIMEWSVWPQADFPRSATRKVRKGEVLKWLLGREKAREPGAPGGTGELPRILAEVTGRDPLSISSGSRVVGDLRLDSLLRIELVSRIEERMGVVIEEKDVTVRTTVGELETLISERRGRAPRPPGYPRWSLGALARALRPPLQDLVCFPWLRLLAELKISGLENLSDLGSPVIFMPNHRSYLDSAAVLRAIPPRFRGRLGFAAARDVLYDKFLWFSPLADLVFNSYPFPSEAEEDTKSGLDYSGRLIDAGWNIVVYPEGRLNTTDRPLLPLKGGAGLMAVEMGTPVVPVALAGTDGIMPPGTLMPKRRGPIEVRFGRPLRFDAGVPYQEATAAVQRALEELLAGPAFSR